MSTSEETKVTKPVIEDRIYVGNVDFKATEDELKELFQDLKVTEVEIPFKENTRGDKVFKRHLGFALFNLKIRMMLIRPLPLIMVKNSKEETFSSKRLFHHQLKKKKERVEAFKAKREEIKR